MKATTHTVSLCDLAVGEVARFAETRLDPESSHLLRALGLTKSSMVRLCKAGEPCIVQVRSTRIGLSRAVAGRIFVVREPARTA
jgi:Fe2+ transport system protein FeoA